MRQDNSRPPFLGENLIFIICAPRSGSTLLQRMLASHSQVYTHPEPHILTPLAFQGVFYEVEKAEYNHRVAAEALREYVEDLPRGKEDYLDACREYCRVLYWRILEGTGKQYFVDKTPNYADTILPFLEELFPKAKYIVLTRHPLAILSSNANTFFNGNYNLANYSRDILRDFVPPIARFLQRKDLAILHVKYEDIVNNAEIVTNDILNFIGLEYEDDCINFGRKEHITKTYGDPKIHLHSTPVSSSVGSWVKDMCDNSGNYELCKNIVDNLNADELCALGYPKPEVLKELRDSRAQKTYTVSNFMFRVKWKCIWCLKKGAKKGPMKKILESISHYISVLLR